MELKRKNITAKDVSPVSAQHWSMCRAKFEDLLSVAVQSLKVYVKDMLYVIIQVKSIVLWQE